MNRLALLLVLLAAPAAHAQPAHDASPRPEIEVDNCPAPPAGLTADQIKAQASEHFDRGEVLYEQGDYQAAVKDLVWAYCMVPRYYTILKSVGQAYERALEYEKAIAYFELYVERIPKDAVRATPCDPDPQADRFTMTSRIKVLHDLPARIQIDTPVKAAKIDVSDHGVAVGHQQLSGAPFDVLGGKTYTATIRADGYVTATIEVPTHVGKPTTTYVNLDRETGTLHVRVTPPEARISLGDRYLGTGVAVATVEATHYKLVVDAPDFVPRSFDVDVLPGRDLDEPIELEPVAQFGRRQLLVYAGLGGAVAGTAGLGISGNQNLAAAGVFAGAAGGLIAAYYGTERDIPLGTSSLTITSSLVGGVAGLDAGLVLGGNSTLFDTEGTNRARGAAGGGGLVLGAVAGYLVGERTHVRPGDAALINSGALWGGVAGHLLGFTFQAPNPVIGGLGLVGLAVGTTGGVLLSRYYAVSRKHAALVDASGVAGMITGVAAANLIFNQTGVISGDGTGTKQTSAEQERTADFALGGLAVGLIAGSVLTRNVDLPKLPVQMQVGHAQTSDGKATTTYGIGRRVVAEVKRSACPLDCPDLCGLEVTVDDGIVTKVAGDHRGPVTDGIICGKVRKLADHMYGDDRVRTPLVRDGAKGSGQFRRASWDEALDLVASRMAAITARGAGEAILPYHYGGSNGWLTEGALATRLFRRLGASRLDRTLCASATTAATHGLYGKMPGIAFEDYVHAKLIVLWGVNPSATGIHLVPVIDRAREAGAKLVLIDPRRTPLARRADLHLPLRPGTDLPVALAAIRALLHGGGADRAFLAAHATGVDELARRAEPWTLDAAAREAEIPVADLARFVELYATSTPAALRCGWGLERNRNGGSAVAAVLALPAIAGKFGVRGGGFTMSNGDARWSVDSGASIQEPADTTRREINMSQLSRALREVRDPAIELLFVYNCNPVATAPDQRGIVEQLAREDLFVVVHEQVMTDTARLADVVLPATTFLEHRDVRRGYGTMRLYDSPAVAAPVGESRSNNELFGALLARLGLERPGDARSDDELVARTLASDPHGAEIRAQLDARGVAEPSGGPTPILFVDAFPGTPDRKIHLVPEALDREAPEGLYTYRADPGSHAFPLALISPALATQISSTFGQLRRAVAELELAPADATARGIATGDVVRVFDARAEVVCHARVNPDVRPGVCVMAKGLWRKHTLNGFTSNAFVPDAVADLGGQATYNDARVQVERAAAT